MLHFGLSEVRVLPFLEAIASLVVTFSLTQSLSHSVTFYQIRLNIQSFQWNDITTAPYHQKAFYIVQFHSTPYNPVPPHTIPYHVNVSHFVNNHIITSRTDSYHPITFHTIQYHHIPSENSPYNFITICTKNTMNL
jgi:hypothetical protein